MASDATRHLDHWQARNQPIAESLVIPFAVVVLDEFRHGSPQMPVRCENPITPPRRTCEPHHRNDCDGEHEVRLLPTRPMRVWASVMRETMLDEAGARCNESRTHQEHTASAVGSESTSSRDIPSGPCAQTAPPPRWLAARETACEQYRSRHLETSRQIGPRYMSGLLRHPQRVRRRRASGQMHSAAA
jgi:hypothetical protein